MKTSANVIQLVIAIACLISVPLNASAETATPMHEFEVLIGTGVYDLSPQEIQAIQQRNHPATTDTLLAAASILPTVDVQFPDTTQKITFAAIAGTIAFLFLFLALFGTVFLRDDEHLRSLKFKTLSPIKLSVVCSFYLIVFSILLSYWVHGSFPTPTPSLLIFGVIALATAIFHHLLKKQQNNLQSRKYSMLQKSLNYLLPILGLMLTAYLIFPVIPNAYFSEAPELLIITYLIISLFHIGVRAFSASISYSPLLKHLFHPGLKRNLST